MPMRISGMGGLGPIELGKRSIKKAYLEDDMLMYAAALAFRVFFALIPFLVFVVALLGVLQIPGFFDWLLGKAQNVLSKDALEQAKLVLEQVRQQAQGGSLAFAAVTVAVWYTSVAVRSLMTALNVVFGVQEDRPVQIRYPLSMLLAVGIALTRSRPAPATCRPRRRGLWQNAEVAARVGLYIEAASVARS
jgi:membrane protein